jgi:hypothetical protein
MLRAIAAGALVVVVTTAFRAQSGDPAVLLKSAQEAMGGAAHIEAVKTVRLRGTLRLRNQMYGRDPRAREEFQNVRFVARAIFPDCFMEEQNRGDVTTYSGFSANTLLNHVSAGESRYPPDMIDRERAYFGYLMLQIFLRTDTVFPFSPQSASVGSVTLRSASGVAVSVDLDPDTGLPKRIRYEAAEVARGGVVGSAPMVIELDEYRVELNLNVNLPHKITTFYRGQKDAERRIDQIELDPPISRDEFHK